MSRPGRVGLGSGGRAAAGGRGWIFVQFVSARGASETEGSGIGEKVACVFVVRSAWTRESVESEASIHVPMKTAERNRKCHSFDTLSPDRNVAEATLGSSDEMCGSALASLSERRYYSIACLVFCVFVCFAGFHAR